MGSRLFSLLLSASFVGTPAAARAQEARKTPGPSVLDGVYTSAQARRGQEQFDQHCATCHRRDLGGFSGPPLKGDRFLDQWREFPLGILFNFMQSQMPLGNPGGLPTGTYLDISAYILETNGLPAGGAELGQEVVGRVLFVAPGGPRPLPTSSPAVIAGCVTKELGNGWFLTNASEPVRTLNPFEFTEAELGGATEAAPAGELFKLQNIEDIPGSTQAADRLVGHKVVAKGILVRHEKGNRLNVATVNVVGDTCDP